MRPNRVSTILAFLGLAGLVLLWIVAGPFPVRAFAPDIANPRLAALAVDVDPATVKRAFVDLAGNAAPQEVIAAVAGAKIRVLACVVSADVATDVSWYSAATAISGTFNLAATGQLSRTNWAAGWWETAAGEALNLKTSAACGVMVWYQEI